MNEPLKCFVCGEADGDLNRSLSGLYTVDPCDNCHPDEEPEPRRHVTDQTHADGVELKTKIAWCGANVYSLDWAFLDAQHFVNSLRSHDYAAWNGCRDCANAILNVLTASLADGNILRDEDDIR